MEPKIILSYQNEVGFEVTLDAILFEFLNSEAKFTEYVIEYPEIIGATFTLTGRVNDRDTAIALGTMLGRYIEDKRNKELSYREMGK